MEVKVNELGIVKKHIERPKLELVRSLGEFGVATIHESTGKAGLMKPYIRPIHRGARLCGTALTVLLQPGDNWMLHVAAEQIKEGDVVVAGCTSDCTDGFFGELLATSFRARGATGLVIDGGVRDVAELGEMGFPVFSRAIHSQGTYKTTLGSVNVPILCGGTLVRPGDVVVGDDDGVVVVSSSNVEKAIESSRQREENEEKKRRRLANGELNLDIVGMRDALAKAGLRYID